MNCVTGKNGYRTKEFAEEALVETRTRFHHRDNSGPIAVYLCDDCGEWHFTSKGPVSDLLNADSTQKRIENQQEANYWERKLRR